LCLYAGTRKKENKGKQQKGSKEIGFHQNEFNRLSLSLRKKVLQRYTNSLFLSRVFIIKYNKEEGNNLPSSLLKFIVFRF